MSATIIWINGAFGAGKTTTTEELLARLPNSMLYDPETIGHALGRMVPASPTGDFQDLPIWRTLVADAAVALTRHYDLTLLVPMTLVNADYQAEIFGAIRDKGVQILPFSLIVSARELRRRITEQVLVPDDLDRDEEVRQWRLDQVERCVAALGDERLGIHITNEGRSIGDVASEILALTKAAPAT